VMNSSSCQCATEGGDGGGLGEHGI
jgi:hypothetical protein